MGERTLVGILKSHPEIRAQAYQRALNRGRANLNETALILGSSFPTVKALVDKGDIQVIRVNKLRYLTLDELERVRKEWNSLCQRQIR